MSINLNSSQFKAPLILITLCLLLVGCEASSPANDSSSASEPKSFYGKSVKQGKDLGKELEARDEEIAREADELYNE